MSINTVSESDYPEWSHVWCQYLDFYHTSLPESQHKNTFSRIIDPNGDIRAFVIRDDSKIVGLCHYFLHQNAWSDKPVCYLNDLFVDPSSRKKGYGKQLITATADAARKLGATRLYWMTKADNAPARRLYDTLASSEFVMYGMPIEQS